MPNRAVGLGSLFCFVCGMDQCLVFQREVKKPLYAKAGSPSSCVRHVERRENSF